MNPYSYLKDKDVIGKPMSYTKEFCPLFQIEPKRGKAKTLQLNKIKQYCEIENVDRKLIINKIYDEKIMTPKENIDEFIDEHFEGDIDLFNNHGGVYKIQKDNYVYIGQTNNFRKRLEGHRCKKTLAYCLLEQGGKFTIVEVNDNFENRLKKEKEYIIKYNKNKNYICININNKKEIKEQFVNIKVFLKDLESVKKILDKEGIKYYDK